MWGQRGWGSAHGGEQRFVPQKAQIQTMVLLISQHLLTYSPHCTHTHTIHVIEQHHLLAVGACGNLEHEAKGQWEKQKLCPKLGTQTRHLQAGRRSV